MSQLGSSLASVVYVPAGEPSWEKVDAAFNVAQFHRKFWGTGMKDEEDARRNREESILAEHRNQVFSPLLSL
jgi:hypothetical protein